jgi:uncharacterized membrane protein YdjX (TVP38/TMEM64 family)
MWGTWVWGVLIGMIILDLYASWSGHAIISPRLWMILTTTMFWFGFALCMRGKYLAWRDAQQRFVPLDGSAPPSGAP